MRRCYDICFRWPQGNIRWVYTPLINLEIAYDNLEFQVVVRFQVFVQQPIINPEQTVRNRIYLPASCKVPLWQGFGCPNMMGVTTGPYVKGIWAYIAVLVVNNGSSNIIVLEIPWFTARAVIYHLSPSTALPCNPRSPHLDSTMHPIECAGYTR